MTSCLEFRRALESKLSGRASARDLCELSWHDHVLSCAECRALLQEEEALDIVLSTLPDPVLPAELAERVLSRLALAREEAARLDDLLEIAGDVDVPPVLGPRVLDRLRIVSSSRSSPATPSPLDLDALLELDRALDVPRGLSRRILDGLAAERGIRPGASSISGASVDERRVRGRRARANPLRSKWIWTIAAGLLVTLAWLWWKQSSSSAPRVAPMLARPGGEPARPGDEPAQTGGESLPIVAADELDPELLASLDVLEEWTSLMQDDLDVDLSTFEPADEVLLEFSELEPAREQPSDRDRPLDREQHGNERDPSKG